MTERDEEQQIDRWEDEGGSVRDPGRLRAARQRMGRIWTALRVSRKVGVAIAGVSVLAVGVALIFLPGPAILVLPLGLAILATEFPWARRLLHTAKARVARLLRRRLQSRSRSQITS